MMSPPVDINSFMKLLRDDNACFSKSQKKIAVFLLNDTDQAAFMNASDVAKHLNVSEATVVRFAATLGFEGFPQLRKFLQNLLRDKVSPAVRMQNKLEELRHGQGHILAQVLELEMHSITEVQNTVHEQEFDAAVAAILRANRVFVFGSGPSKILAELIELRFNRFGIHTIPLIESGRDILEKLLLLKGNDVMIVNAFNRITGELVAVLKHAKSIECDCILITDIPNLELQSYGDQVLHVVRGPMNTFHSLTAPMTVINAIILAIALARPEESLKSLSQLEDFRKEYDLDAIGKL